MRIQANYRHQNHFFTILVSKKWLGSNGGKTLLNKVLRWIYYVELLHKKAVHQDGAIGPSEPGSMSKSQIIF